MKIRRAVLGTKGNNKKVLRFFHTKIFFRFTKTTFNAKTVKFKYKFKKKNKYSVFKKISVKTYIPEV